MLIGLVLGIGLMWSYAGMADNPTWTHVREPVTPVIPASWQIKRVEKDAADFLQARVDSLNKTVVGLNERLAGFDDRLFKLQVENIFDGIKEALSSAQLNQTLAASAEALQAAQARVNQTLKDLDQQVSELQAQLKRHDGDTLGLKAMEFMVVAGMYLVQCVPTVLVCLVDTWDDDEDENGEQQVREIVPEDGNGEEKPESKRVHRSLFLFEK